MSAPHKLNMSCIMVGEVYLFSFLAKMYAPFRVLCLFIVQDCDSICVVAIGSYVFRCVALLRTFYLKGGIYLADMGTREASKKWGVSQKTVERWCRNRLIEGVTQDRKGSPWHIPKNAIPPKRYFYSKKKGKTK